VFGVVRFFLVCSGFRVDRVLRVFALGCFVAHSCVIAFSLRCLRWGWFFKDAGFLFL